MKRGEIYWIEPSVSKVEQGSVQWPNRPAIIVSNDKNNAFSPTVEVVYLSASPKKPLPTHTTIESALQISTALCEQVNTISVERIGRYLGTCTEEEMEAVGRCIAISLGLDWSEPVEECSYDEDAEDEDAEDIFVQAELNAAIEQIEELKIRLAKAERGEDIYRSLYNELMDKVLHEK